LGEVKTAITWLLTAPLLVIGLLAGHAAGYRWALPDPHQRAHALEESGHAYSAYVPIVVAVALTLVAAALIVRIRAVVRGEQRGLAPPPWLLALLPPAAFLFQEFLERWLSTGHVHLATLWAPAVLIGLQLQIPFALLALAVARLLSRAADAIGRAIAAGLEPVRVGLSLLVPAGVGALSPARTASRGWSERGPPLPSC
jgi:hypothetical protein